MLSKRMISVNLLKERLELEVALRREGARFLLTLAFSLIICVTRVLYIQPRHQYETRWIVLSALDLSPQGEQPTKADSFLSITKSGNLSRVLFPLSSSYVSEGLSKAFVGGQRTFSGGPVVLPLESRPRFTKSWSMHTWLGLPGSMSAQPKKLLLAREKVVHRDRELTCWALYCRGTRHFTLEYGEHTHGTPGTALDFWFEQGAAAAASASQLTMVALSVNATHASFFLQGAGQMYDPGSGALPFALPGIQTLALPNGTAPTECPGGTVLVGDDGLTLAAFEYHPYPMTEILFHEFEEVGQPVAELAMGLRRPSPHPIDGGHNLQLTAHRETQELVGSSSEDLSGLVRLTGSMSFAAATAAASTPESGGGAAGAGSFGTPVDDLEEWRLVAAGADGRTPQAYFQAPAAAPCDGGASDSSALISGAFDGLRSAGASGFTLAWWTRPSPEAPQAAVEEGVLDRVLFTDPSGNQTRLEATWIIGPGLPRNGGWVVRLNGAPLCARVGGADALCMRSPAFWCQAPDGDGLHSVSRHVAISFDRSSSGGDGARWNLTVWHDGRALCGVSFPSAGGDGLVPFEPLDPEGPEAVEVEVCSSGTGDAAGSTHVFPRALSAAEVLLAASDPAAQKCVDLGTTVDNSTYRSDFGQGCADLAEVAAGSDPRAPGGCQTPAALLNCPVACMHERGPACYDGLVPVAVQSSRFGGLARAMLWEEPMREQLYSGYQTVDYWEQLRQLMNATWTDDGSYQIWHPLVGMADFLERGHAIVANDLLGTDDASSFWVPETLQPGEAGWCPGTEYDSSAFQDICRADVEYKIVLAKVRDMGVPIANLNLAYDFESGKLMKAGSSYFMHMVVKPMEEYETQLVGLDTNSNVCFKISMTRAYLYRRNQDWDGLPSSGTPQRTEHIVILDLPQAGRELRPEHWVSYGISVDAETGSVLFSVNEHIARETLSGLNRGLWGCDGLAVVLNSGAELQVASLEVAEFPMLPGRIQQHYLSKRSTSARVLGPRLSGLERAARFNRSRLKFSSPVIGISPPVLLQSRKSTASNVTECPVMEGLESRMEGSLAKICRRPYYCDGEDEEVLTDLGSVRVSSDQRFFGHAPKKYQGRDVYPDFAWSIDTELLVRDGQVLIPKHDYIDSGTERITLILPFFALETKVAGIMELELDFRGAKIKSGLRLYMAKVLSPEEYVQWCTVMGFSIALALVLAALALPAAIQEFRRAFRTARERTNRLRGSLMSRLSSTDALITYHGSDAGVRGMRYTEDTTQPDLLDVAVFLALAMMLLAEIFFKLHQNQRLQDDFRALAEKDWGDDTSFDEKMRLFLNKILDAEHYIKVESDLKVLSFVVLVFLGIRLVIFMKVHPRLASVARTFEMVGAEMANFLLSFGIIFFFLAFTAHVMFGTEVDEFSTVKDAMLTQFTILLSANIPSLSENVLLTIYVVGYVLLCTLALLNFFLAIIVNGYTQVQEEALENKVAKSFFRDMYLSIRDVYAWSVRHRHSWPSKLCLLNILAGRYPRLFENGYEEASVYRETLVSSEELQDLIAASPLARDDVGSGCLRILPAVRAARLRRAKVDEAVLRAGAATLYDHYVKNHPYLLKEAEDEAAADEQ